VQGPVPSNPISRP